MRKTWISKTLILLLVVAMLTGCAPSGPDYQDYSPNKQPGEGQFDYAGNYAAPELKIDGKDDDAQWASAPVLTTFGNGDAASVKAIRGKDALFFFVTVRDPILLTEGNSNDDTVTRSDSVEIYLDTKADGGSKPQSDDYQINLGIHGKTRIMQGSGSGWGAWNGLIDYEVTLEGTLNDGMEANDSHYCVEIMIPYAQIGIEKNDTIGIAFAQVDKFGAGASVVSDWNWFGWTYNGALCEPQTPSNYILLDGSNTLMGRDEEPRPDADMAGYVQDLQTQKPVAGVSVKVEGTELVATTDNQGYFAFEKVNSNKNYTLTFEKDGYYLNSVTYTRQELRDSNGGRVLKNIDLRNKETVEKTILTGVVKNVVYGIMEGATVLVEGTDLVAVSGADGSFSIENVPADEAVTLLVTKDGYGESRTAIAVNQLVGNGVSELGDVNLSLLHAVTENFGNKSNAFADSVLRMTRTLTGIELLLSGTRQLHGNVEIYLDVKESAEHRDKDATMWRFDVRDDGSVGVDNYAADGVGSAAGLSCTMHFNDATGYAATLLIPYSYLGIAPLEVFGISLGQWSTAANDWDGWGFAGQFVAPELPGEFIRMSAVNELYRQENNNAMVNLYGNAGMGGIRVEAAGFFTTTGADGSWSMKIPATSEAVTLTYARQGYNTKITTIEAGYFTANYFFTEAVELTKQVVTLSGTVTDDTTGAPVAGVQVSILDTEFTAVTDADGKYTIENLSTERDIAIRFALDGYAAKEESVSASALASGDVYTLDVKLVSDNQIHYVTLQGSVSNVNGPVAGAMVSVLGNSELTATTDAEGKFAMANFPAVDCVIRIEKDGYIAREIVLKADDVDRKADTHTLENQDLWLNYAKLYGIIADKSDNFAAFQGYVTRSDTGIEFKFVGNRAFNGRLELFVDTKTSAGDNGRDLSDYLFNLNADGTITIVNWGEGTKNEAVPANMKLTVEGAETGSPVIYFTLPYDFFGQVDANAAITATEVIGISAGQWSTTANDWDGWDNFALPGANKEPFVKPEMPTDYIRIGAHNEIYNYINNDTLELYKYPIQFATGLNAESFAGSRPVLDADYFYADIVSRNETGVTFKFLTTGDFSKEGNENEMVLIYIDKGESVNNWENVDYLIKVASDGTVYGKAGWPWWSATDADKLGTVEITRENGITTFQLTIPYEWIGVAADETFGFAMREASHNAGDHHLYDPWYDCYFERGNDIGTPATGIDAAWSTQYIRVDAEGNLYRAENNE